MICRQDVSLKNATGANNTTKIDTSYSLENTLRTLIFTIKAHYHLSMGY